MATGKAIQLAENSEWDALSTLIDIDANHATDRDRFGMYVLHWLCTDKDVPLPHLEKVHKAFSSAIMSKNNSQMLPLHIAVQNKLPTCHITYLVAQYPSAVDIEDEKGRTPLCMEKKYASVSRNYNTLSVLQNASCTIDDDSNCHDNFQHQIPSLTSEMKKIRLLLQDHEKRTEKKNKRAAAREGLLIRRARKQEWVDALQLAAK